MAKPFDFVQLAGCVSGFVLAAIPAWFLFGIDGVRVYAFGVVALLGCYLVRAVTRG